MRKILMTTALPGGAPGMFMETSNGESSRRSVPAVLIHAIQLCVCILIGIPLALGMMMLAVACIFVGDRLRSHDSSGRGVAGPDQCGDDSGSGSDSM
jgi:hypothetical protein